MHEAMAATLDGSSSRSKIQHDAREQGNATRPRWPMIVLNSPKGWTGPKVVDGLPIEGTFRSHQVPITDPTRIPSICSCSRTGSTVTGPTNCSMTAAA